jgi:hypothetical protein
MKSFLSDVLRSRGKKNSLHDILSAADEIDRLRALVARYETIQHESEPCPRCAKVKAECADIVAELEISRRQKEIVSIEVTTTTVLGR